MVKVVKKRIIIYRNLQRDNTFLFNTVHADLRTLQTPYTMNGSYICTDLMPMSNSDMIYSQAVNDEFSPLEGLLLFLRKKYSTLRSYLR